MLYEEFENGMSERGVEWREIPTLTINRYYRECEKDYIDSGEYTKSVVFDRWAPIIKKRVEPLYKCKELRKIEAFLSHNPFVEENMTIITADSLFYFLRSFDNVIQARPDDLDYELCQDHELMLGYKPSFISDPVYNRIPKVYDMNIKFDVEWGGSEGIYASLWFENYNTLKEHRNISVATIKTLNEDDDSFRAMSRYATELYLAYSNVF